MKRLFVLYQKIKQKKNYSTKKYSTICLTVVIICLALGIFFYLQNKITLKKNGYFKEVSQNKSATKVVSQSSAPVFSPTPDPHPPAMSYGIWTPSKYDTCTKQFHDSFYVIGPDGKKYPTWHPPVAFDPKLKKWCSFGHEHGDDPSKSPAWPQIKAHYAYKGDLAHAGIPFGYVNEQLADWTKTHGFSIDMRNEDHVGHKIEVANDHAIVVNSAPGQPNRDVGIHCNYVVKVHQGTYSKDAFSNNLHEVLFNDVCSDGHEIHFDTMAAFGAAGQFTRQCDAQKDRQTIIQVGFDNTSRTFPSGEGSRGIPDRQCIEAGFLVPAGKFSANPYEAWNVSMGATTKNGKEILYGLNMLFDVEDSIRYYYPGQPNNVGYFMDLCYETQPNGNKFRGGACDAVLNKYPGQRIAWNDPRSGFRDINRGTYFKPGDLNNAGGPTTWYTDPFGRNAQTTPFPGSVKQYFSAQNINYGQKFGAFEDANVFNKVYDDGGGTVHAPN